MCGAQAVYRSYGYITDCVWLYVVGERCDLGRSGTVRSRGLITSENAGMSNEKQSENLCRRKPKVSSGR